MFKERSMVRRWPFLLLLSLISPLRAELPQGWTCVAAGGEWHCKLVGPPPKGRKLEVEERPFLVRSFTDTDEERFFELLQRLEENPWTRYCATGRAALGQEVSPARGDESIEVEADFSETLGEGLTLFSGNVEGRWGAREVRADMALYDSLSETVHAWNGVLFRERSFLFRSESAFLDLKREEVRLSKTRFLLASVPARGKAERSLFEGRWHSYHARVRYTTCPPGREDWVALARSLKIDRRRGIATAHHAQLRLFGLPVFYAPYLSHPIDDRRLTGFLAPRFGRSESTGFDFAFPFYWNLAPNYDLTLTPRFLTNRGFLAGLEFRYLLPESRGTLAGELIPFDYERKRWRGQVSLKTFTRLGPNGSLLTDINFVSDRHFINEIGDSLSIATRRHVRSEVTWRYRFARGEVGVRAENHQTIDPRIPAKKRPYRRLPQVWLWWEERPFEWLRLTLDGEAVFFHREKRVRGVRLDLRPALSFPLERWGLEFTPKAQLVWTEYFLKNTHQDRFRAHERKVVPIFSLDLKTALERAWGDLVLQTLEPRIFYVLIPRVDQSDLPLFDTTRYDFNFSQLFRENRYTGRDLVGDTHRISAALTTRFLVQTTGSELLRLSLGQSYSFRKRKVVLPGEKPEDRMASNLIAAVDLFPHRHWTLRVGGQWDPEQNRLERVLWMAQFRRDNDHILNLAYRMRRGMLQILDGSFRWELWPGFHGVGRWQHDLRNRIALDIFGGVEMETCCLRLRLLGRHFVRNVGRDTDQAFYAQLELKGLVQLGKRIDRFLERSIRGYRLEED